MKLTKCANGHFYDEEKYSSCPHCSGGANNGGYGDSTTESFVNPGASSARNNFGDDDVTVSNPGFASNSNIESTGPVYVAPSPMAGTAVEADDEKTQSFVNWTAIHANERKRADGEVITKDEQRRETAQPVVGWLVCISGSNYGKAFQLYSGRNFIGRDISNEVCLTGDPGISRIKHAVIIYEPKQRRFYAQPGDSSHELFYLNDEVVLTNILLSDRDVLTIGQNTLVFVPFCDERNGWDSPKTE